MSLGNPQFSWVDTWEDAEELIRWLDTERPANLGCDTETGGLDWWREPLRVVQFGDANRGWVVPFDQWKGLCQDVLRKHTGPLTFFNAKFDLHFLETNELEVGRHRVNDAMVLAHLTDNTGTHALKSLGVRLVDPKSNVLEGFLKAGMNKNKWSWKTVPIDYPPYWMYAAMDPILTVRVWDELVERMENQWWPLYDMEMVLIQQAIDFERRGIRVDLDYCRNAKLGLEEKGEKLKAQVAEWGVMKPSSNIKVIKRLMLDGVHFTKLTEGGEKRREKGRTIRDQDYSLDEEVLDSIEHPLAALVKDYRHTMKIANTYLGNFISYSDDGFIHPSVRLLGARTGRMSIGRPSIQNLERSAMVRDAIIPREDHTLLLIDYDQIELRILASDAGMTDIIEGAKRGDDLHTLTAQRVYGLGDTLPTREQRGYTKNGTFSKLYGAGLEKFAATVRLPIKEAQAFLEQYDAANPEIVGYQQAIQNTGHQRRNETGRGYVDTAYGRRLYARKDKGMYTLVNYRVQGTALDVLKDKMARLHLEGLDQYLVAPIHDELVFDVPNDEVEEYEKEIVASMEDHKRFAAPLTVGVDRVSRWGDKYRDEDV